jgi:hypothetical protein
MCDEAERLEREMAPRSTSHGGVRGLRGTREYMRASAAARGVSILIYRLVTSLFERFDMVKSTRRSVVGTISQ